MTGRAIINLQFATSRSWSTTKNPIQKPKNIPMTINNWLSVPAGPPMAPGNTEVKYVGIIMVLIPATRPNNILEKVCTPNYKFMIPIAAATIVK